MAGKINFLTRTRNRERAEDVGQRVEQSKWLQKGGGGPLRVDTDFDALLPEDVTQKVSAANEQM